MLQHQHAFVQPCMLQLLRSSTPSRTRVKFRATCWQQQLKNAAKLRRVLCPAAANSGGQGRQFETELFRKLFGAPPPPKQDNAGGGGNGPPDDTSTAYEEEEEPDEDQIRQAKLRSRQQALFNCITILLFLGLASAASTWEPHFQYLGRIWQVIRLDSRTQTYAELGSEVLAWALLLSMGWPWNLLIYPTHLTRKEFTNARKDFSCFMSVSVGWLEKQYGEKDHSKRAPCMMCRPPSARNIRNSVWNPFARKPRPRPQPVQPQIV